jgi:hypothetical protein
VPVDFFCYPRGLYDAATMMAVRRAGYLGATTCVSGFARPASAYEEDRIDVSGGESLGSFARSLQMGFAAGATE